MFEIRRDGDDELCGHVTQRGDEWVACTFFGAVLGTFPDRSGATEKVLTEGLASLSERWTLTDTATGERELVCTQEANAHEVTVALGYYSVPGVPTQRIDRAALDAGAYVLER